MNKQQGSIGSILVVVIALVVVAGGAYYIGVNWPPKTLVVDAPIENIYQNNLGKFSFTMPKGWYAHETQGASSVLLLKTPTKPNVEGTEGYAYGSQITVHENVMNDALGRKISQEEYSNIYYPPQGYDGPFPFRGTVNVGEKSALRVVMPAAGAGGNSLVYVFFSNNEVYTLQYYPYEIGDENKPTEDYTNFMEVVNSFKYTE